MILDKKHAKPWDRNAAFPDLRKRKVVKALNERDWHLNLGWVKGLSEMLPRLYLG